MARLGWKRRWDAAHETADGRAMWHDGSFQEWSEKWSERFPFHRDDGVTITVSDRDDGSWDRLVAGTEQGDAEPD